MYPSFEYSITQAHQTLHLHMYKAPATNSPFIGSSAILMEPLHGTAFNALQSVAIYQFEGLNSIYSGYPRKIMWMRLSLLHPAD